MKQLTAALFLTLFLLTGFSSFAQTGEELDQQELDGLMLEGVLQEDDSQNLVIDNTRTKVGRDFYYLFYRQWSVATIDTNQTQKALADFDPTEVLVSIEELPSMGVGLSNVISITVNDQLVWQQFVQSRYDLIEAFANNAVEAVRQYIASYEETQKALDSKDQMGSGVF